MARRVSDSSSPASSRLRSSRSAAWLYALARCTHNGVRTDRWYSAARWSKRENQNDQGERRRHGESRALYACVCVCVSASQKGQSSTSVLDTRRRWRPRDQRNITGGITGRSRTATSYGWGTRLEMILGKNAILRQNLVEILMPEYYKSVGRSSAIIKYRRERDECEKSQRVPNGLSNKNKKHVLRSEDEGTSDAVLISRAAPRSRPASGTDENSATRPSFRSPRDRTSIQTLPRAQNEQKITRSNVTPSAPRDTSLCRALRSPSRRGLRMTARGTRAPNERTKKKKQQQQRGLPAARRERVERDRERRGVYTRGGLRGGRLRTEGGQQQS